MADQRTRVRRELERVERMLEMLRRHGTATADLTPLVQQRIELRRELLAELERGRRPH